MRDIYKNIKIHKFDRKDGEVYITRCGLRFRTGDMAGFTIGLDIEETTCLRCIRLNNKDLDVLVKEGFLKPLNTV